MKRLIFSALLLCILSLISLNGNILSLSRVFEKGAGILDRDGDGHADAVALTIILPDNPILEEIAIAGDIAARANFETLSVDFTRVITESQITDTTNLDNFIIIGSRLRLIKTWEQEGKFSMPVLLKHQGIVQLITSDGSSGIILLAGSSEAFLKTGRAFFMRWPFLWEIWGREEGATYGKVEQDLMDFLEGAGIEFPPPIISSIFYEFPNIQTPYDSVKKLRFNFGEIKELTLDMTFPSDAILEKTVESLENLARQHRKGDLTDILTYPGCAQINLKIQGPTKESQVTVRRMGYPKRMLTPSYKSVSRPRIPKGNFDLLTMLSVSGLYSDSDRDLIPDTINTSIIISPEASTIASADLASRLTLHSAGASFPLVFTQGEIEDDGLLRNPLIVGQGRLSEKLIKTGKLKTQGMEPGWGVVTVIPSAFNPSNAVTFLGADRDGLNDTLRYFSRTFPYFENYGEGNPKIDDIPEMLGDFLDGKRGGAEAFFMLELEKLTSTLKDKTIESISVDVYIPKKNPKFSDWISQNLKQKLAVKQPRVNAYSVKDSKIVFQKNEEFPWEGDDVFNLIRNRASTLKKAEPPLKISIGVSESPQVRKLLSDRIEKLLLDSGIKKFELEVLSSYKQGFFWLTERVASALRGKRINRLQIRFAEEKEDFQTPKRFYSEPFRWLQELYPVDDILSKKLGIPIENIEFEVKQEPAPTYEIRAFNDRNTLIFKDTFNVTTREMEYLSILPEWGNVKLTTGWLQIKSGESTVLDIAIPSDLEIFWEYYQDEILSSVNSHILNKTGDKPTFDKQPYFKRLMVEMWFSEPDYKIGLDEEIISSLESMHDELYFDTLDYLRGITKVVLKDEPEQEDTSRYSAPGNILPLIHPSTEGKSGKVKVVFEDWQSKDPQLIIKYKTRGEKEQTQKISFKKPKVKEISIPSFVYNGPQERIEKLDVLLHFAEEKEYIKLIDLISAYRDLNANEVLPPLFVAPKLDSVNLILKHEDLDKEEPLKAFWEVSESQSSPVPVSKPGAAIVPTTDIISPDMCLELVEKIKNLGVLKSYIGGTSFEGRTIPVLEAFSPKKQYVSLPRLITLKPTLYLSGRQHANEVSATNYILRFAEYLSTDKNIQEYMKKMNFILHPMENPDGAALAFALQKITPFHSLHAGRYSSLGIDVGYQVGSNTPILPEAKVRKYLNDKWLPDIYLNLHGYPSHEWVQQFSNYSPYLFRDYWIPRGWFAYFRGLSLPIYRAYSEEARELRETIVEEMNTNTEIKASNTKMYDRYFRWASRWQPHMNNLELSDGLNLYSKRRSSRESTLSGRRRVTFVEETPELMDETAQGEWLDFLVNQGLTYIMAHVKYLDRVTFPISRIEEEIRERISIRLVRARPGDSPPKK
ncbi:M14 family metallopeptidase [Acidobacteriota bacterium]